MKKIAALVFSALAVSPAFATNSVTPTSKQLVDGYLEMRAANATNMNSAEQFILQAIASRNGFVKNNFETTLSANVAAGVSDDNANSRFGVVAGSNKGYNVFTGSSVGGSISACGAQVAKTVQNLGASLVVTGTLNLANANGCGR